MKNTTGQGNTDKRPEQNGRNSQPVQRNANKRMIGTCAEERAAVFLQARGMQILARNYRCRQGEIDLIARDGRYLVFVEVKSRSNINYGYPSEAVNYKKKQKITNVAKYYILNNCLDNMSIRFDVIEVYLKSKKINHIVNAF